MMRVNFSRLAVTAFLALLLSACKTVTVEQPEEGAVLTDAPDIVLSFPNGRPDPLKVTLNGFDITSQFDVTDSGAMASGNNIESFLIDGENLLKVVNPNTPLRKFFFDKSGPLIHVTQVSGNLTISGYAEDPSGVASLKVNGKNVNVAADNSFTVNISNSNFVEFVSRDNLGYTRTQRFARPQVAMDEAIGVRINRDGLNFLENEIETIMTSDDFGTLITNFNPIKEDSILGNNYRILANDASLDRASMNLEILGSNGNFGLSGALNDIWADVTVEIDPLIGFDYTIDGSVTLSQAEFDATANLGVSNGDLWVEVNVSSLNLTKIRTDINNFPDWLLTPFLEAFEWAFEWILKGQIEEIAEEKLLEFIDVFPSTIVFEINGGQVAPEIDPSDVATPSNGVSIKLGAHLVPVTSFGPAQVGSNYVGTGDLPEPTSTLPNGSEKDVGAIISEDMINQALAAATASGMLNLAITASDIPELSGLDDEGDVRVSVVPKSAPIIDLVPNMEEGLGRFRFMDFYLGFEVKQPGQSDWTLILGATINMNATADLGISENNAIAVSVIGVPSLKVIEFDENSSLEINEAFAQSLIDEFTPIVVPVVMAAVGAIPLPTFEGYGINVGGMWVLDNEGHFVGVAGDLVKTTTSSSAAMPSTFASLNNGATAFRSNVSASKVEGDDVTIYLSSDQDGDVSYRYSLNGAPFGLWSTKDVIKLYNLRDGDHTVTVCSRSPQLVEDTECATVNFTINTKS